MSPAHQFTHFLTQQDMDRHWTFYVPPELLCRIFQLSLHPNPFAHVPRDDNGDPTLSLSLAKMTTPFTLGAVCRYWRYIAWRDPHLWNSIYLVANPHKAAIQARLLTEWLSRSGQLPLSIDIDCSSEPHKKWSSAFAQQSMILLKPVYQYSSRFISFRTRLPPQCLPEMRTPEPRFVNLTTLTVDPWYLSDEDADDDLESDNEDLPNTSIFQHSTRLRHLIIGEIHAKQLLLPWNDSRFAPATIATRDLIIEDCLSLLRSPSNLVECRFGSICFRSNDFSFHNINLPRLQLLLLDFTAISIGYQHIFRHITAPNLRKLVFLSEEGRAFPTEEFQLFLQRSACPLSYMEIKGPQMTAPDIQVSLNLVSQSLEYVWVDIRFQSGEPVQMFKPTLTRYFPRMQNATFSAPVSILHALFPPPH